MRGQEQREAFPRIYRFERGGETVGCIVVDSTIRGRAGGGLRIVPEVRVDHLLRAARAKTLKYGLVGLSQGGAKAAAVGDPEGSAAGRVEAVARFARGLRRVIVEGAFSPAADMGTDEVLIRTGLERAGIRRRHRELRGVESGLYTAHSVLACARRAAFHLGLDWPTCTAAVEGFGKVGANLADLLRKEGVRVIAVSTRRGALVNPSGLEVDHLLQRYRLGGKDVLPGDEGMLRAPGSLWTLPVDFLFPCADAETLREGHTAEVRARVICPGANNALTPGAEAALLGRGVFCLPGFLVNAGGVIGGTMEYAGVAGSRVSAFVERNLGAVAANLMEASAARGVPLRELAADLALRRFSRMKRACEHPRPLGRGFRAAVEVYRRGLLPRPLVALIAPAWFRHRLRGRW